MVKMATVKFKAIVNDNELLFEGFPKCQQLSVRFWFLVVIIMLFLRNKLST